MSVVSPAVLDRRYSLLRNHVLLSFCFLSSRLLLFSFFLSGFFLGDRFLALVSGRSSSLSSIDQLLGSFEIIRKRPLLLFGHGSHNLLEFLQRGNRLRDCVRRTEVGNTELIVGLSHLRVIFDCLLESLVGRLLEEPNGFVIVLADHRSPGLLE